MAGQVCQARQVPRFEPFTGVRYDPRHQDVNLDPAVVTAPPYDVIDTIERQALAERSPYNIVHVDVPVPGAEAVDPYEEAAASLQEWRSAGILVDDPRPALTRYRMSFTDEAGHRHRTLGVLGALELNRPGEGDVLPHERTTPKAKSDRLRLLQATGANLSPIWGLSLARGLSVAIAPSGPADAEWTDDGGVSHEWWRVDDPQVCAAVSAVVATAPVVVADGHHRYETSLAYRDERRAAAGGAPGAYDLTLALLVELTPEQLVVQPIHRLLTGIGSFDALVAALDGVFTRHDAGAVSAATLDQMTDDGALCLVAPDGTGTFLVPKPDVLEDADREDAHIDDLDSARLEHALALAEPRPSLTYQHGIEAVLARLRAGEAAAAVLLRPVPVGVIEAMAHARALMPPKSTFFAPKPATGVVIRPL